MYKSRIYNSDILDYIGKSIHLQGWLANKRDHGSLLFYEIRDHTGLVQVVVDSPSDEQTKIPLESVIEIVGNVRKRDETQINDTLFTGTIEVECTNVTVIAKSDLLPFEIDDSNINDDLKIKYRYLYLRGEKLKNNLQLRANLLHFLRNYMYDNNFIEVQTPIITCSSPEGARDFLIPSRLHKGKFYAMPQAPQIFKQLLMVGGVNQYFQIAPCFRDEDARKDRCYGEFWQLDVEMSFSTQDQILHYACKLIDDMIQKFNPDKKLFISQFTYKESMDLYGSDKPDLRADIKSEDWTAFFAKSEMKLFKEQVEKGAIVKALKIKKILSTSIRDKVLKKCEENGFRTGFVHKEFNELKGPIAKFIDHNLLENNEMLFFLCNQKKVLYKNLGILRKILIELGNLVDKSKHHLVKIVDFPMFEQNEKGGWDFTHNPFSKPQSDIQSIDNLSEVVAYQYDLVLNGFEIASGSIRNNDLNGIISAFKKCGYKEQEIFDKFRSLLNAFKYGVPPHGGFAFGIERILMILSDEDNVREVVAFPLNTNGVCPMTGAPTCIKNQTLEDLSVKIIQ